LTRQCHSDVVAETNEDELDRELFEPTHAVPDGDDADINAGHGVQDDDDGIIKLHAQGTTTSSICLYINHVYTVVY
jgi:hypothetical protein